MRRVGEPQPGADFENRECLCAVGEAQGQGQLRTVPFLICTRDLEGAEGCNLDPLSAPSSAAQEQPSPAVCPDRLADPCGDPIQFPQKGVQGLPTLDWICAPPQSQTLPSSSIWAVVEGS